MTSSISASQPSGSYIGVFDSGLGGLSVWREIVRHLPAEDTLYFADQGHVPYGPRSLEQIRAFSRAITEFLLEQGAKIIVVACNTASGAALHDLRATYPDVPFIGMEPAVKPAAEHTTRGSIGVLATPSAFQGVLFRRLVDRFGQQVTIHTQICPGLVEAVEAGALAAPATRALLQDCLAPLVEQGIDQLVLGCTHYPFLRATIEDILGPSVAIIDPAPAVASQVGRVLRDRGHLRESSQPATHLAFTSGSVLEMREMARTLVGYTGRIAPATWLEASDEAPPESERRSRESIGGAGAPYVVAGRVAPSYIEDRRIQTVSTTPCS